MSYEIGGNSFTDYNMRVKTCSGALDFPKRLGDIEYNWGDDNGVEPYVSAEDLKWNGKQITIDVLYVGSNLRGDVDQLITDHKGSLVSLVTSYGTFTVNLSKVRTKYMYKPNGDAELAIEFWQPTVTIGIPPTPVGGSGSSIGSFDLKVDLGMVIGRLEHLTTIPGFVAKARTYGDTPKVLSQYHAVQKIVLYLYGKYNTTSAMLAAISNLEALLCSADLKAFGYHGNTISVYFADGAQVYPSLKHNFVTIKITLRVAGYTQADPSGTIINFPGTGPIGFPGTGTILFPNGDN